MLFTAFGFVLMPAVLSEGLVGPSGISTWLHTTLMQATSLFSWLFVFNFYWTLVDLQCCVSFCCTEKWISYPHTCCCCSVTKSMWPHGSRHNGLPCPSLSPGVCWNSCPLSRWCHPIISFSITPFSSCPQSFPASGAFQWVSSLHQVAEVLQLQHQSFHWIFKTDFL